MVRCPKKQGGRGRDTASAAPTSHRPHHHRGAVAPRDRIGPLLFGSAGAGGDPHSLSTVSQRRKSIASLRDRSIGESSSTFPTVAQAKAAEDPTSLAAEVAGKAWPSTLGPKGELDTWGKPGRGGRPGTVSGQSPRSIRHASTTRVGRQARKRLCTLTQALRPSMCCRGS